MIALELYARLAMNETKLFPFKKNNHITKKQNTFQVLNFNLLIQVLFEKKKKTIILFYLKKKKNCAVNKPRSNG